MTEPGPDPQIQLLLDALKASRAQASESKEMLAALSQAAFEAVLVHRDGKILLANRAAEVAAGVGPGELLNKSLIDFIAKESHALSRAKISAGDEQPYEAFGRRADGSSYPLEVRVRNAPVQFGGSPARVVALRDLSAQKQLQEQFRQAQKMEAVGRLAGGVAHDFNNMLAVIVNATELALDDLPADHSSAVALNEVMYAAERATELTRQLLAFSRKQVFRTQVIELGGVLRGMESMIGRLLGGDIELAVDAASRACIQADRAQLEMVLVNLIVNARHAMPDGGKLSLSVREVAESDAAVRAHCEAGSGPQVLLEVGDTGIGMDAATLARVFEPFFTTKEAGQGTGLGLSSVFGIVKQSGGSVWVESEPGRGSSFKLCFPRCEALPTQDVSLVQLPAAAVPGKTVLVVEDEPQLRRLVVLQLEEAGYHVLAAERPDQALELALRHEGQIDLLLTDVTMPGMNGKQLAERMSGVRPGVRVLYVSGHGENTMAYRGMLGDGAHFVPKPFTRNGLLETVARVLA